MDLRERLVSLDRFPLIVLVTSLVTGVGSIGIGLLAGESVLVGLGVVWAVGGLLFVRALSAE